MFLVSDTREARCAKIRSFVAKESIAIAVLLATANFEWTVRRAIICLSKSPNRMIKSTTLRKCSSLDDYKDAWRTEIASHIGVKLPNIIGKWGQLSDPKKGAYDLRNKLIHGVQGTTGLDYGRSRVEALLNAAEDVDRFCRRKNVDLYKRLPVRKRAATKR